MGSGAITLIKDAEKKDIFSPFLWHQVEGTCPAQDSQTHALGTSPLEFVTQGQIKGEPSFRAVAGVW